MVTHKDNPGMNFAPCGVRIGRRIGDDARIYACRSTWGNVTCKRCLKRRALLAPNLQRCPACGSEESSKQPTWCKCNATAPYRRISVDVIEVVDRVLP